MAKRRIECYGEGGFYPEDDFLHDKDGVLVNPPVHMLGQPHYVTGVPVDPGSPNIVTLNLQKGDLTRLLEAWEKADQDENELPELGEE